MLPCSKRVESGIDKLSRSLGGAARRIRRGNSWPVKRRGNSCYDWSRGDGDLRRLGVRLSRHTNYTTETGSTIGRSCGIMRIGMRSILDACKMRLRLGPAIPFRAPTAEHRKRGAKGEHDDACRTGVHY